MTIQERFAQFLEYKEVTQKEFSKASGIPARNIRSITNRIKPGMLEKISSIFPEINIKWLLRGDGEMVLPGFEKSVIAVTTTVKETTTPQHQAKKVGRPRKVKAPTPQSGTTETPQPVKKTRKAPTTATLSTVEKRVMPELSREVETDEIKQLKARIHAIEVENNRLKGAIEANEFLLDLLAHHTVKLLRRAK